MRSLSLDIRCEVRQLFAARAFAATAALTLSVGIGCTTATYSVVEGVLLRPLPFADPQRLVQVGDVAEGDDAEDPGLPAGESILLTRNTHSFQSLGAYQLRNYELSGPIDAAQIAASRLNASVFSTLGVSPMMGRVFTPEEDVGSAPLARTFAGALSRRILRCRMVGDCRNCAAPKYSEIILLRRAFRSFGAVSSVQRTAPTHRW